MTISVLRTARGKKGLAKGGLCNKPERLVRENPWYFCTHITMTFFFHDTTELKAMCVIIGLWQEHEQGNTNENVKIGRF